MQINLKARFSTDKHNWICLRHAIILSIQGEDVQLDIDDYDSDYYMGGTVCKLCANEPEENGKIGRLPSHYSGSNSLAFWDIIQKVDKGNFHSEKFQQLYKLAVQLQVLETGVLNKLTEEEL